MRPTTSPAPARRPTPPATAPAPWRRAGGPAGAPRSGCGRRRSRDGAAGRRRRPRWPDGAGGSRTGDRPGPANRQPRPARARPRGRPRRHRRRRRRGADPGRSPARRRRRGRARRPRSTVRRHGRPSGRPGGSSSGNTDQRIAEREVEVDGAGPRTGGVGDGARDERPPAGRERRRRARRGRRTHAPLPPNRCVWSMVCGAATSRSSGGRSAVQTTSGTSAWCASTTAAWSSAAAVPLVHTTSAGRPVARPTPSAANEHDRSSWKTCNASSGRSASASASGVEREPGSQHDVAHAGPDRLVGQRGAERGGRAHLPIVPRIVLRGEGRHLVRRRLPVVLHRQAAVRGGAAALPGGRRRHRHLPGLPARSGRPAGCRHARPGGLRAQVRSRPGGPDDRPGHRDGRRGGADLRHGPGRAGQHPAGPPAAVAGRASAGCRRP